jgi:hypothetical protein
VDTIAGVNKYGQTSINLDELAKIGIKLPKKKSDEKEKSVAEIDKQKEEFQLFMTKIKEDIRQQQAEAGYEVNQASSLL